MYVIRYMATDMGISQLDIIKRQTTNAAARLGQNTSLVAEACRLTGWAEKTVAEETGPDPNAARNPGPMSAQDGRFRRSPVQELWVPPDYHKRILRRVAGVCVAVSALIILLWVILRSGLLSK